MTYAQALSYLDSFMNHERKTPASVAAFGLERAQGLMRSLHVDITHIPVVHIAGTKGKGSTAAFMAGVLACSGKRVGLYTSPHLITLRERIVIQGQCRDAIHRVLNRKISEREFACLIAQMRPVLEESRKDPKQCPTWFEILTVLALKYFQEQGVDWIVLETGLGGRLDATNVVTPVLSIITRIELEHTALLGKTVAAIAGEKAGIIKPRVPVISVAQHPAAAKVIRTAAAAAKAPLYMEDEQFHAENIEVRPRRTDFAFCSNRGNLRDLYITQPGAHQVHNAALACMAALVLKESHVITGTGIYDGLARTSIDGRFQRMKRSDRQWVLDIAHTPDSIAALMRGVEDYFPDKPVTVVFGCSSDKNAAAMLSALRCDTCILTRTDHSRALAPEALRRLAGKEALVVADLGDALKVARDNTPKNGVILVTGSTFTAAQALQSLK